MEKIINFEERNQQGELIRARFVKPVVDEKIPLVIMLTGDGPRGSNSMSWINLSPRLGISHPITNNQTLFFSYGHFFELINPKIN